MMMEPNHERVQSGIWNRKGELLWRSIFMGRFTMNGWAAAGR
jgi:hypothetical protein